MINAFPGYEYIPAIESEDGKAHNMYMGEDASFGGYVYAEPGIYYDVALLDIQSLHPSSMINMNYYGEYTQKFKDIYDARVLIKHKDYDAAGKLMNGLLKPFLTDDTQAKQVSQALKIALNSTYGLTSASFDNPFKHPMNINNIVALRGALFMINLKNEVQKKGFRVAHIKTDSIKIPNATPNIIKFCMDHAKKYGYIFEHEATYDRICLVNDAVYIAKYKDSDEWTATGTQFAVPYVFKTLFSKEPITFNDYCETKTVTKGELYLDMNEGLPDEEHAYAFIGRAGQFVPIKSGRGGGILYRKQNDKYYAATGTKGFRWLESEVVRSMEKENDIDGRYHQRLANEAIASINEFGNFEEFVKWKEK